MKQRTGGKHELPDELLARMGVAPCIRAWRDACAIPARKVVGVEGFHLEDLFLHREEQAIRQQGKSILATLAVAHEDASVLEIQVLHPQPMGF